MNDELRKEVNSKIASVCSAQCMTERCKTSAGLFRDCYGECSAELKETANVMQKYRPYSPYYYSTLSPHYEKINWIIIIIFIVALIYYRFFRK